MTRKSTTDTARLSRQQHKGRYSIFNFKLIFDFDANNSGRSFVNVSLVRAKIENIPFDVTVNLNNITALQQVIIIPAQGPNTMIVPNECITTATVNTAYNAASDISLQIGNITYAGPTNVSFQLTGVDRQLAAFSGHVGLNTAVNGNFFLTIQDALTGGDCDIRFQGTYKVINLN